MTKERAGGDTDAVLVSRIREGDEEALSRLYRRYVSAIYRFVLAQVRNVPDAEDLTAETFARMLGGLESFRGDASFKNWLYQIARNAVRNHRRSVGYRRTVPLSPRLAAPEPHIDAAEDAAEDEAEDAAARQRALALLAPLPPRYRQVLELRFLDGRSVRETARLMGVTVANAKVLQHRALKKAVAAQEPAGHDPAEIARSEEARRAP